ncbi:hypothetical protein SPRG_08514 [Saprolegnia parasitica CBS 223.65]|uniref:Low temperature requirement protein A n=1 Tax=Saprolegnia parasitica (strain CBS 223.65) TaxID=695850 RepID=A0A067C6M5_SAPPC|nr:hypothetical protein SPRG_08514 [Saprolegnia parasitica CBS 223.65]KDO26153.1 hypothetical protein SPRG_08514 [Saprolegnia parasitica CBS 223.65]|eukprot:XP_012203147.1 hypothetical protein SPRG_08514 [Saprolegnia parasitica CBS 223.65]
MLRTLLRSPRLSADWTGHYEHKAIAWVELVLDGTMMAASYAIATRLEAATALPDVVEPLVLFGLFVSLWQLYTHFHARFAETSFLHYLLLYFVVAGVASMVLSPNVGAAFGYGLLLSHLSMLAMYVNAFAMLPETRARLWPDLCLLSASSAVIGLSLVVPHIAFACYGGALCLETIVQFLWAIKRWCIPLTIAIPVSIEYITERHGTYVVVVLLQTTLGALFTNAEPTQAVHLSLLLVFTMAMFYFAVQPPRELHAMRRSVAHGVVFVAAHYALLPTLLVLGVAAKLAMVAVAKQRELPPLGLWLLFGSISATMLAMLLLRSTHYGGRKPLDSDVATIRCIKAYWWMPIGLSSLLPLAIAFVLQASTSENGVDPILALGVAAASLFVWVVAETLVMHWLVGRAFHMTAGETDPLLVERSPRKRGRTSSFFTDDD